MNRLAMIAALLAIPCTLALAQEIGQPTLIRVNPGPGAPNPGGPAIAVPGAGVGNPMMPNWGGQADPSGYIKMMDPIVNFTDDQKAAITTIYTDRAKDLSDSSTQNADKLNAASAAISDANKAGDNAALMKAYQDYQAASAPMQDIMKKYADKLDKVMTNEQKAKYKDYQATSMIKMLAAPAQLTDQQIKAVKIAGVATDNPRENYQAYQEALQNILTPDQKSTINKSRALSMVKAKFWSAKLTADQQKQLDAAADQIVKDRSLETKDVADQLTEKANALLTPDQKKAMENAPQSVWLQAREGGGSNPAPRK